MKKIILFLTMIISTAASFAQDGSPVRFGVKGGINFSNMYTKDVDKENLLLGYHVGAFLKVPLNNRFAVQPELTYSIKGSELTYDNSFVSGKAKFQLDYIDLDVLAVFNITDNVNFHVGPYFGFLSNVRIENDSDNGTSYDFENELDKNDFETTDLGLVIGAGLDFGRISAGARYNYGLKEVGKERDFYYTKLRDFEFLVNKPNTLDKESLIFLMKTILYSEKEIELIPQEDGKVSIKHL